MIGRHGVTECLIRSTYIWISSRFRSCLLNVYTKVDNGIGLERDHHLTVACLYFGDATPALLMTGNGGEAEVLELRCGGKVRGMQRTYQLKGNS